MVHTTTSDLGDVGMENKTISVHAENNVDISIQIHGIDHPLLAPSIHGDHGTKNTAEMNIMMNTKGQGKDDASHAVREIHAPKVKNSKTSTTVTNQELLNGHQVDDCISSYSSADGRCTGKNKPVKAGSFSARGHGQAIAH
ncbi:hypothetical protein L2E82_44759 [Cichorium intybus]|uniref:Uncharacterized protein n=1 Tax=Cichorium intybus TaxID=13427 RepID=A0ACB8ZRN4_CICIN|nr:hypothetical protein L2E82_44759 [Cichorium intybus]